MIASTSCCVSNRKLQTPSLQLMIFDIDVILLADNWFKLISSGVFKEIGGRTTAFLFAVAERVISFLFLACLPLDILLALKGVLLACFFILVLLAVEKIILAFLENCFCVTVCLRVVIEGCQ